MNGAQLLAALSAAGAFLAASASLLNAWSDLAAARRALEAGVHREEQISSDLARRAQQQLGQSESFSACVALLESVLSEPTCSVGGSPNDQRPPLR